MLCLLSLLAAFTQWVWWTDEKYYLKQEAEALRDSVNGAMELLLGNVGRAIVQKEQQVLWHKLCRDGCATWIQAHVRGWTVRNTQRRDIRAALKIQKVIRGRNMRRQMRAHKPGRGRHQLPKPEEAEHLVPSGAKVLMRRVTVDDPVAPVVVTQDEGQTKKERDAALLLPDGHGKAFRAELSRRCQVVCESCSTQPDEALNEALEWLCQCLSLPEPKPEPEPKKGRPGTAQPALQQRPATAAPVLGMQRGAARPSTAEPSRGGGQGFGSGRPQTAAPKVRQAGAMGRPSTAAPTRGLELDEFGAVPQPAKAPKTHDDEVARRARDIVDSGVAGWLVTLLNLRGPPEKLSTEALFQQVDIDGDGRITQEEALIYMKSKDDTLDMSYVMKIWDAVDDDGNGTLDITEFPAFLEAATMLTPEEQAARDNLYDRPMAAAWLVTNLAAVSPDQTAELCNCAGGGESLIYALLNHVRGDHADRAEQAVWALANVAAGAVELRDFLLDAGGIPTLMKHVNDAYARGGEFAALNGVYVAGDLWPAHWSRRAAVGLATLCGGGDPQPEFAATSRALPLFGQLLHMVDEHVVAAAMRALACLSEGSLERVRAVTDIEGLMEQVGELMRAVVNTAAAQTDEEKVRNPSSHKGPHPILTAGLVIVRNVCTANCLSVACADSCVQCVIDAEILPLLLHQLYHEDACVRGCTCAVIANILAGSNCQIEEVLMVDQTSSQIAIGRFIPKFMDLLNFSTDPPEQEAECYRKVYERGQMHAVDVVPEELDMAALGVVRMEASFALANFAGASHETICTLLDEDGLAMLGAALVTTVETATTWLRPPQLVPAEKVPSDDEIETARETLEPLLMTIEKVMQGKLERDSITEKATRRKRPKSALTVGGVALSMDAEEPPWVVEEQREKEDKMMAPIMEGCRQLLLLPEGEKERETGIRMLFSHFGVSEEWLDQEEEELRRVPVEEVVVRVPDPTLSVQDKLFCCREYTEPAKGKFSALSKQSGTLKHTFNSMYLYVAEKSDLNSRVECIWFESRYGGESSPTAEDKKGKLTYYRATNPRTGVMNENWDNRGGLRLIDAVLQVLEEENCAAKWTEVCQALAAPKLALCYADAAVDGVKVKETHPAPPPSLLAGFGSPPPGMMSPMGTPDSLGRPSTAASRRLRLASRASPIMFQDSLLAASLYVFSFRLACCYYVGASGGSKGLPVEATGPQKVELGDTNHVSGRLMAARHSSHHDYSHVMQNLEQHFSMSEEDERRHRVSTRVR